MGGLKLSPKTQHRVDFLLHRCNPKRSLRAQSQAPTTPLSYQLVFHDVASVSALRNLPANESLYGIQG